MNASSKMTALVYLLAFMGSIGNPIVLPALPFMMEELDITPMQMGMMISMYALPGACILPFYGMLSDRLGRRAMLLGSLALCVAGSLLCVFAPGFSTLIAGRALQGLSITPLDAMSFTLVTDLFEGVERVKHVQRCSTVQFFAVTAVPVALACLIPVLGWRAGFMLAALISALSLILSYPVRFSYQPHTAQGLRLFLSHLGHVLASWRMLLLFAVRILVAVMIFGVIYPHLPLLMVQKLGFAPEQVGIMFSIYALGMFLGSLLLPLLAKRLSTGMIGITGSVFLFSAVAYLAFASQLWHIGAGLLCVGMGSGVLIPRNTAYVSLCATEDTHGSVMSAYSTIFRLGQALAPGLMGMIYALGSFGALFSSAAVLALVTGAVSCAAFVAADRKARL